MRQPASRKGWRKKADDLWKDYIKSRDKICQHCGRTYGKMDAHHLYGRHIYSTRFLTNNGMLLCFQCHRKAHDEGKTFWEWYLSDPKRKENADKLEVIAYQSKAKLDYQAICESLKGE